MARFLSTLITLLLTCATSSLLSSTASARSIEFRVFGVGQDNYEGLYYFDGKNYQALKFHRTSRSLELYQYKGSSILTIYVINPDYTGKHDPLPPFLPIATTQINENIRKGLLIFSAIDNNSQKPDPARRFRLIAIDDDPAHFPANSIVIVNTTQATLYGRVAEQRLRLPTGATEPINYKVGHSKIPITLAVQTTTSLRLALSNDIQLPNSRRIVLILEAPRRKRSTRLEARVLSESAGITGNNAH